LQALLQNRYRFYRLFYTLFSLLALVAVLFFQFKMNSPLLFHAGVAGDITGLSIAIAGLILMLICIRHYFLSLSGLMSLFSNRSSPQLIIKGIHLRVRHPLYAGTFLFIWGLWLYHPLLSHTIANAVITIYTVMAIPWEEAKLVHEFGDAYRYYQSNVPALIPRIGKPRKNKYTPPK
jgi:methanethiol S-methyltransferase